MSRKIPKSKFMRIREDLHNDPEARWEVDLYLPTQFAKPETDRSVVGVDILIMGPTEAEVKRLSVVALKKIIDALSSELACLEKLK